MAASGLRPIAKVILIRNRFFFMVFNDFKPSREG
jgi:hypothetical protein